MPILSSAFPGGTVPGISDARSLWKSGHGYEGSGIADDLDIARNTVRRYLNSPKAMKPSDALAGILGRPAGRPIVIFLPLPASRNTELLMEVLMRALAEHNTFDAEERRSLAINLLAGRVRVEGATPA